MNTTRCFMVLRSPAEGEICGMSDSCACPYLHLPPGRGEEGRFPSPPPWGRTKEGGRVVRYHAAPAKFSTEYNGLRPVFAMLAAALWLSGCMVGPDYERPPAEIPPQFRAAMTPDATSIGDFRWLEVFRNEHLQELIRVALVQNYDLRDAIARVDAARANLGITRSNQFPNFCFGAEVPSTELSTNGQFTIPKGGTSVFSRQR